MQKYISAPLVLLVLFYITNTPLYGISFNLNEVIQTKNDFIAGATEGMIALQCHWTATYSPAASKGMPLSSWRPGATHRYRNIAIKKL